MSSNLKQSDFPLVGAWQAEEEASENGYLLAADPRVAWPVVPMQDRKTSQVTPVFSGSVDEFVAENEEIRFMMKNKVKKCPACGKPNAFTLKNCNACGEELGSVKISYTNNVFTGFIYGIAKGPFPLSISLRHEDKDFMVFDDLMQMTPCHVNCIPTSNYIPDWRFLLRDPTAGLQLVSTMAAHCGAVLKTQFWENAEWRKKFFADSSSLDCDTQVIPVVLAGFNYPPSQYQLHLQYMCPPMYPFQYHMFLNGVHYTPNRFFPLEYVLAVLKLNEPYDVKEDTPITDITAHYAALGVRYEGEGGFFESFLDRAANVHVRASNWAREDFLGFADGKSGEVRANKASNSTQNAPVSAKTAKEWNAADKVLLQQYGRPYHSGRPSGVYYAHAKKAGDLKVWSAL